MMTRRQGPSPRVRGSLCGARRRCTPDRSIPACAGKPIDLTMFPGAFGVHPRVCGEAGSNPCARMRS